MAAKKRNVEVVETPVVEEVKKPVKAKVNCEKLNFRKAPGGDVISILDKGTSVTILEDNGIWTKIKVGTKEGFVMTEFISK